MTTPLTVRSCLNSSVRSIRLFATDVGHGMLEVSHNTLALVGLVVVATLLFAGSRTDLRDSVEQRALDWLLTRQEAREPGLEPVVSGEPTAVSRATAANLHELPQAQAAIAQWLARRYRVAPEPVSRLVQEAWTLGHLTSIDPTLILAVMAVESSFNPFAQSPMGAQGLMQVMTRIHDDKYLAFGGIRAAFDPIANLKVGVQVLKECIARGGSLEAGLRRYVGGPIDGDGYVIKVMAEQLHLKHVAEGKPVPIAVPAPTAMPNAPARLLPAEAEDRNQNNLVQRVVWLQ